MIEEVRELHIELATEIDVREVDTRTISTSHTTRSPHSTHHHTATRSHVIVREVSLVDIVAHRLNGDTAIAIEDVEVHVALPVRIVEIEVIAKATYDLTEHTIAAIRLCRKVHCLDRLAIIDTSKFSLIRLLVIDIDRLNDLGRERLESHTEVIVEELLAIDQDLLYCLTLSLHALASHLYTRHFRHELLGRSTILHLVGIGIVSQGVASLLDTVGMTDGLYLGKHTRVFLQVELTDVGAIRHDLDILGQLLIAHIFEFESVFAWTRHFEGELAILVGNGERTCSSIRTCRLDSSSNERLTGLAVEDITIDGHLATETTRLRNSQTQAA